MAPYIDRGRMISGSVITMLGNLHWSEHSRKTMCSDFFIRMTEQLITYFDN